MNAFINEYFSLEREVETGRLENFQLRFEAGKVEVKMRSVVNQKPDRERAMNLNVVIHVFDKIKEIDFFLMK